MMVSRSSIVVVLVVHALAAHASKPCKDDDWFGNENRSSKQWAARVSWVAVGQITEIHHDVRPMPNCHREDRSRCAHFDFAKLTIAVTRMDKGKPPSTGELHLSALPCSKPVALDMVEGSTRYRFFGNQDDDFVTWEEVDR
jgi:hypothetical protein